MSFKQGYTSFLWLIGILTSFIPSHSQITLQNGSSLRGLLLTSNSSLPSKIRLGYAQNCSTLVEGISPGPIVGMEKEMASDTNQFYWDLTTANLPKGPICLAIWDDGASAISNSLLLSNSQTESHQLEILRNVPPWKAQWIRPEGTLWTHVQLIEADSSQLTKERILWEQHTQATYWDYSQCGELAYNAKSKHWLQVANAYDASPTATDRNSWIRKELKNVFDSLIAPTLKSPSSNASIARANLGEQFNFLWSTVPGAKSYSLGVWTSLGEMVLQTSTSDSGIAIDPRSLPNGNLIWSITAHASERQSSQSLTLSFTLDALGSTRRFQTLYNGIATNGIRVAFSSWNGGQSVEFVSSTLDESTGRIDVVLPSGEMQLEIQVPHGPSKTMTFDIPDKTDTLLAVSISNNNLVQLSMQLLDSLGIAQSGYRLQATDSEDRTYASTPSSVDGRVALWLPIGSWFWQLRNPAGQVVDSGWQELLDSKELGIRRIRIPTYTVSVDVRTAQGTILARAPLHLLDSEGNLIASTSSDEFGYAAFQVPSGRYSIQCFATGAPLYQHPVDLVANLHISIVLGNSIVRVQGLVRQAEEAVVGSILYRNLSHIPVLAWQENSLNDTLRVFTNDQGRFSLDLPSHSGTWIIATRYLQKQVQQSLNLSTNSTTAELALRFQLQARVEGYIDAPSEADSIAVFLEGDLRKSVYAQRTPADNWFFRFFDVVPGTYKVIVSHEGLRQIDTTTVTVTQDGSFLGKGTYITSPVQMEISDARLSVHSFTQIKTLSAISAQWHLLSPPLQLQSFDTVELGDGVVRYNLYPDDSRWLALLNHSSQSIRDSLKVDSIQFPAFHNLPQSITPLGNSDSLRISLELYGTCDTVQLWIEDSLGVPARKLESLGSEDSAVFRFPARDRIEILRYRFVAKCNGSYFANSDLRPFSVPVLWPLLPPRLASTVPDTLRMATGARIPLEAFVKEGLHDSLDIHWTSKTANVVHIASHNQGRNATITALKEGLTILEVEAHNTLGTDTIQSIIHVIESHKLPGKPQIGLKTQGSLLMAGESVPLSTIVQDSLGRGWNVPAHFSVVPNLAGIVDSIHHFKTDSLYIGPIQVIAEFRAGTDTLPLSVGQWISPYNDSLLFWHDSTIQIQIPDSAWNDGKARLVQLKKYQSLGKRGHFINQLEAATPFVNLYYSGSAPDSSFQLRFRLPFNNKPALYRIDSATARYHEVHATPPDTIPMLTKLQVGNSDTNQIDTFLIQGIRWLGITRSTGLPSYWGILMSPDTLRKSSLILMPNPFSPWVTATIDGNNEPGCAIRFTPVIPGGERLSTVSITIHAMNGDPLRKLVQEQSLPQEPHVVYWDGRTDDGLMVRNGRYLVLFTLRKTGKDAIVSKMVKPVVVFK